MENLGLDPSDPLPPQSEQFVDLAEESFLMWSHWAPVMSCRSSRRSLMRQIRSCAGPGCTSKPVQIDGSAAFTSKIMNRSPANSSPKMMPAGRGLRMSTSSPGGPTVQPSKRWVPACDAVHMTDLRAKISSFNHARCFRRRPVAWHDNFMCTDR